MKSFFISALLITACNLSFGQVNLNEHLAHNIIGKPDINRNISEINQKKYEMDSVAGVMQNTLISSAFIELFPQRPFYNRSFKFNSGASVNTYRLTNSMLSYNDTSDHKFTVNGHTPVFSFTQQFALDSTFSLSYTLGYSQSNILYDNNYYGTKHYFISLNPEINIIRSYNWEYYMKLKIGLSYYDNRLEDVPSDIIQRLFPSKFHMFTGVTIAGINYFINDNLAFNAELSIWSPETINFGLTYRFFKTKNKSTYLKPDLTY